jgi:hypothetical protein
VRSFASHSTSDLDEDLLLVQNGDGTNGITPVVILSSSGSQLPYSTPNNDPAAFPGQGISYVNYDTPMSKSLQWNLAVERALGTDTVAYAGASALVAFG